MGPGNGTKAIVRVTLAATLAALFVAACELIVQPGALQSGADGACGAGFKSCSGAAGGQNQCVAITDPEHGCAAAGSCAPCAFSNAHATCVSGACALGTCATGYKVCPTPNGSGASECVSTSDPDFQCAAAGSCAPCDLQNAIANCVNGACGVFGCVTTDDEAGNPIESWADCNGQISDGCESNLENDVSNCGVCDAGCPLPAHARIAACTKAVCGIAECEQGYTNTTCDGGTLNSCVPADEAGCNDD